MSTTPTVPVAKPKAEAGGRRPSAAGLQDVALAPKLHGAHHRAAGHALRSDLAIEEATGTRRVWLGNTPKPKAIGESQFGGWLVGVSFLETPQHDFDFLVGFPLKTSEQGVPSKTIPMGALSGKSRKKPVLPLVNPGKT